MEFSVMHGQYMLAKTPGTQRKEAQEGFGSTPTLGFLELAGISMSLLCRAHRPCPPVADKRAGCHPDPNASTLFIDSSRRMVGHRGGPHSQKLFRPRYRPGQHGARL